MIDMEIFPLFCMGPLRLGSDARAVQAALGAYEHREDRPNGAVVMTDFWLGGRFQVHYAGENRRVNLIEVALDPRVLPRLYGVPIFAWKASDLLRHIAAHANVRVDIRDGGVQCVCPSLELALRRTGRDDDYFSVVAVGRLGCFSSAGRVPMPVR